MALLWWRRVQCGCGRLSRVGGRRAVLRPSAPARRCAAHQSSAADPLWELDKGINAGWPAFEAALKASGKTYEAF